MDEVRTVYQHCQNHQERALLSIAYGCGLRRSEIEALDIKDIQFISGMVIVRKGKNSKRREVPMSNSVMEYLRCYLSQERYNIPMGDGALFVNDKAIRISGDLLNTMLKKNDRTNRTIRIDSKRNNAALPTSQHCIPLGRE